MSAYFLFESTVTAMLPGLTYYNLYRFYISFCEPTLCSLIYSLYLPPAADWLS